jgi:hypothetical protein
MMKISAKNNEEQKVERAWPDVDNVAQFAKNSRLHSCPTESLTEAARSNFNLHLDSALCHSVRCALQLFEIQYILPFL